MSGRATAMLLCAGRGERMRPLSDSCPKPLLPVRGKPLAHWLLADLRRGGCRELVMNTAWLGQQLSEHFGEHPSALDLAGLHIAYSQEGRDFGRALETAGGIARALPLLDDVFWLCAGDIYAPAFEFSAQARSRFAASDKLAHLWLVPNPPQHPQGDFGLDESGCLQSRAAQQFTYSTIGLYRASFFAAMQCGNPDGVVAPLVPMLRAAMERRQVTGELYHGVWADAGTPQRLAQLNLNA